ncbi:PDZ domain-containing protein [Pseudogracilibacillus sp. SE30717A]|uniref:PDZ domain-containing protein n=1 Tax=Pseudogracilibacillus sp. SE30717A TaxID=3098293 RepID=UPI00300DC271
MLEIWLIEAVKGIGRFFSNPLLYWTFLLFILTGYRRIRRERFQFGTKLYSLFAEGRRTFTISFLFSIILSALALLFGIVISVETIIVLTIVMILLSILGSTTMLSASYTIGITFLLLLVLPFIQLDMFGSYVNFGNTSAIYFICLAIIMGLFLLVEALLVGSQKHQQTFPYLSLSERGVWIGNHELKRLAFIPFFTLLPIDAVSGIAPFFPYFEYGGQTFSLILIPFFIGYQYSVRGELPHHAAYRLGQATLLLSLLVLFIALGSLFLPYLSFVAIIVGIVGKEWIMYQNRMRNKKHPALFTPLNKGIKVLAMIPDSPADRLGILVGETILKVNGRYVINSNQFYEALQNSGAFFKLDVIDINGEIRFINSPFYEEDHYELGIIFPESPALEQRATLLAKTN